MQNSMDNTDNTYISNKDISRQEWQKRFKGSEGKIDSKLGPIVHVGQYHAILPNGKHFYEFP